MDDSVPLVVPEINAADVKLHKGIIANPNCTTAITLMALYPLHQAFGVQAHFCVELSGGVGHGREGDRGIASGRWSRSWPARAVTKEVYPHQIAFNVLPQVDSFLPTGYTKEEMKMENEGPQDHASPELSRERDVRARAGVSSAFGGGQRGIREAGDGGSGACRC